MKQNMDDGVFGMMSVFNLWKWTRPGLNDTPRMQSVSFLLSFLSDDLRKHGITHGVSGVPGFSDGLAARASGL